MRLVSLLLVFAGCQCGTLTRDEFAERYPYGAGPLYSRGGIDEVVRELEARTGGPLVATNITISPATATFTLRDPKRPGNLDDWSYVNGTLQDPSPKVTSRRDVEDDDSFAVAQVALGRLRDLVTRAVRELAIEQGTVGGISVRRVGSGVEIVLQVRGPRSTGRVTFDAKGELVRTHVD